MPLVDYGDTPLPPITSEIDFSDDFAAQERKNDAAEAAIGVFLVLAGALLIALVLGPGRPVLRNLFFLASAKAVRAHRRILAAASATKAEILRRADKP